MYTHCEQVVFAFEPVQENEYEQHRNSSAPLSPDSQTGGSMGGSVRSAFLIFLILIPPPPVFPDSENGASVKRSAAGQVGRKGGRVRGCKGANISEYLRYIHAETRPTSPTRIHIHTHACI